MAPLPDSAGPVRPGEELELPKLEAFLRAQLGALDGPVSVEQFRHGHSNLTYLIHAGPRELVLRRPPFSSKVKSAHDMGREHGILSRLCTHYPAAPRPVAWCDDPEVLGAPFYLMERVRGVILRGKAPEGLFVSPTLAHDCCEAFAKGLADLHALDFNAMGLEEFHRPGHYVARQVNGWRERYQNSRTDDIPDIENAFRWLAERVPPDTDTVLIHNDYKFDNLVLDPADLTLIIGVLDWEMCTIGDPLMDLGTSLSYWADAEDRDELKSMQCFLTSIPGAYNRQQVADRYAALTGRDTSNILFYYVFGLLKLAVIMQQIYYRFKMGTTKDQRFGALILFIYLMGQMAAKAIETGKISA